MMDHERYEKDLQEVFEETQRAYQAVIENAFALQEQTLEFARSLLESSMSGLGAQSTSHHEALDALAEQSRRQRQAMESLVRESAKSLAEVFQAPFSHHHHQRIGKDVTASGADESKPPGPQSTS